MFFNSLAFAIFLPVVFIIYWFVTGKSLRGQNIVLIISSYVFYGWWDYRFLFLLIFSTFLDYYTGLRIAASPTKKAAKMWLLLSIIVNLGFLGFFKYYNFFVDSFGEMLTRFGFHQSLWTLKIILPVGISFYTFHGLSYVFDIFRKKIEPTKDFVDYSVFVCFFPLLVAGPIERATHLLPQVKRIRSFDYSYAVIGLRQILWGLFKKVVIADSCSEFANVVFAGSANYHGSTLVVGAFLFAVQIYGDFSGYSDIALGTAKLFGFDLLINFRYPYFSRDIAEFWRRWHISLSSWFRDYLYIPLGGSRGSRLKNVRNIFIIFIVSGFWHGANWTFIVWGALNALYFLPLLLLGKNRENLDVAAKGKFLPSFREMTGILITFALTVFAWIFFRAETLHKAVLYIRNIFTKSLFAKPEVFPRYMFAYIFFFFLFEWWGREEVNPVDKFARKVNKPVRWLFYFGIILLVLYFSDKEQQFIYFQF